LRDPYRHLAGVYDEIVVDPCHASWADHLERMWAGDGVHRVLDLCCGSGLMTVELIRRGHDVVGLDASAAMLARARSLLGPDVLLVESVLPDLPVAGPFDAVVSTLDGLNYLPLPEFRRTLSAAADVLRPGGWLVFDLHTDAALTLMHDNPVLEGTDAGLRFVLTSTVDDRACTTTIEVEADDPSRSFAEEHVQYVHADDEVRAALTDAGLDLSSVTDEYTDEPVVDGTLRATWTARRQTA
jgi:SAM-dependent methyltransferase